MARTDQAKIRRFAVFVKELRNDRTRAGQASTVYLRRPYNIVEYDWNDGAPKTYVEPTGGRTRAMAETQEVYDEVRIFDTPPAYDTVYGGSA